MLPECSVLLRASNPLCGWWNWAWRLFRLSCSLAFLSGNFSSPDTFMSLDLTTLFHRRFFKLCTSLRKWNGGKLACMLSELVCIYGLGFTTWYIDLVKFFRGALIISLIGDKPQDFVYFLQVQCHDPQVALEYEPRNLIFTTVFLFKNHTYITSKYCAEYWLIKTLDLDYVLHVDNVVCLLSPFQYLACSTLNKSQWLLVT